MPCSMWYVQYYQYFFWTVITNTKYVFKLFWVYSHYVTSGRPKTGGTLYKSVEFVKPYGTVRVLEQRVSYFTLWLFPFKYLFKWKFLTKLSISWSPIWNTMNNYGFGFTVIKVTNFKKKVIDFRIRVKFLCERYCLLVFWQCRLLSVVWTNWRPQHKRRESATSERHHWWLIGGPVGIYAAS